MNYELDSYLEVLKDFPDFNTRLKTKKATAFCVKSDIFQRKMWFIYQGEEGGTPVCLKIDQVQKVIEQNKNGITPKDLKGYEEEVIVEESPDYGNVVGQDSLHRFDKKLKQGKGNKRHKKKRRKGGNRKNKKRSHQNN